MRTGDVWTRLSPAATWIDAAGGAFAAVGADGVHGDLHLAARWFAFDGVPALYARVLLQADAPLAWDDPVDDALAVRPLQAVPLDLAPTALNTASSAALLDPALGAGVAVAWVEPPADPAALTCDPAGCFAAGTEGQAGAAAAGEAVVDQRLLVLVPLDADAVAGGPAAVAARVQAVRELPSVAVGAAVARP
ncbi:MAG: hypothetical protein R3F59_36200 [Myxococcota bacterium]